MIWCKKMIDFFDLNLRNNHFPCHYREKGDYKKSNDFAIAMNSARDSVFKERELEQTAIASGEQLYRRSREAEQEAREAATRYKLYMLSAVVAVLFVTLMIFLLYSMRLKAFNKRLMEKDRLLRTTNVAESIECRIKCVSLWRNIVI